MDVVDGTRLGSIGFSVRPVPMIDQPKTLVEYHQWHPEMDVFTSATRRLTESVW